MEAHRHLWLDQLRFVAMALMVLDHGLLFFVPDSYLTIWVRLTVTRCAEPLFVFVMVSVVATTGRALRPRRWVEIVAVSAVTSWLLSVQLGYALLDVLVSIALVTPLIPICLRLSKRIDLVLLSLTAGLAVVPVAIGGVVFDYSPLLLLHQVFLAKQIVERRSLFGPLVLSMVGGLFTGAIVAKAGADPSAHLVVLLIGNPLAMAVMLGFREKLWAWPTWMLALSQRPLLIYGVHLMLLRGIAVMFSGE